MLPYLGILERWRGNSYVYDAGGAVLKKDACFDLASTVVDCFVQRLVWEVEDDRDGVDTMEQEETIHNKRNLMNCFFF